MYCTTLIKQYILVVVTNIDFKFQAPSEDTFAINRLYLRSDCAK